MLRPAPLLALAVFATAGGARAADAPDPVEVELGGRWGAAFRVGSSPSFPVGLRTGGVIGAAASLAPSRRFALGLAYEHGFLGTEVGSGSYGTAFVTRTVDAVWATIRVTLYGEGPISFGIALGPGLAWQTADLSGAVGTGASAAPLTCTERGYGPDIGLRVALGTEILLTRGCALDLSLTADELRLSSDGLGACVPGMGSTTSFGAHAGVSFRFDVSRYVR